MNKGDRVTFQGRAGTVECTMPNGMVDIRFDDATQRVERRAAERLGIARSNPRRHSPRRARRNAEQNEDKLPVSRSDLPFKISDWPWSKQQPSNDEIKETLLEHVRDMFPDRNLPDFEKIQKESDPDEKARRFTDAFQRLSGNLRLPAKDEIDFIFKNTPFTPDNLALARPWLSLRFIVPQAKDAEFKSATGWSAVLTAMITDNQKPFGNQLASKLATAVMFIVLSQKFWPSAFWTQAEEEAKADDLKSKYASPHKHEKKVEAAVNAVLESINAVVAKYPGDREDFRWKNTGQVICKPTLASFDQASRLVRGKEVPQGKIQLPPTAARQILNIINRTTLSDEGVRKKAVQRYQAMNRDDQLNLLSNLHRQEAIAEQMNRDVQRRQLMDDLDREQKRLKTQLYTKKAEDIESDLQRIVARERGAFFTRQDPPRLSDDNRVYCGNPIDGVAYYLVVDKSRRWDAPFVKWDDIHAIAARMFKEKLAPEIVEKIPAMQILENQSALSAAVREATEAKVRSDERVERTDNKLRAATLSLDLNTFLIRLRESQNFQAVQAQLPDKLAKAKIALRDKSNDVKAEAVKFMAAVGDKASLEPLNELNRALDEKSGELTNLVRDAISAIRSERMTALPQPVDLGVLRDAAESAKTTYATALRENVKAKDALSRAKSAALASGGYVAFTVKDRVKAVINVHAKNKDAPLYEETMFNRAVVSWQKKDNEGLAPAVEYRMDSKAVEQVAGAEDRLTVTFPSVELINQMEEAFASFMGKMEHKKGVRIIPIQPRHRAYMRIRKAKHYSSRGTTPRAELTGKQPKAEPAGREPNRVDDYATPTERADNLTYYIQSGWVAPGYNFLNSFEFYDYKTFNITRDCTLLNAVQENLPCGETVARALIASGAVSSNPFIPNTKTVAVKGYPEVNTDPESKLIGPRTDGGKSFAGARVAVWLRDKAESPFFTWTYTNTPVTTSTALAPCLSADELELRNQLGMLRRSFQQLDSGFSQVRSLFRRLGENPASLKAEREDPNMPLRKLPDGTWTKVARPQFGSDARQALSKIVSGYTAIERWFFFFNMAKGKNKNWANLAHDVLERAKKIAVPSTILYWSGALDQKVEFLGDLVNDQSLGTLKFDAEDKRFTMELTVPTIHATSAQSTVQDIINEQGLNFTVRSRPADRGASFDIRRLRERWNKFKSDTKTSCSTCGGEGTVNSIPCSNCGGKGIIHIDSGLIAPGGRSTDIGDARQFDHFMTDYYQKLLKDQSIVTVLNPGTAIPRWEPNMGNAQKKNTRAIPALRWLAGDLTVTPVDDLYAYVWDGLSAGSQVALTKMRRELLEGKALQTYFRNIPPEVPKQFEAFIELLAGRYQAKHAEHQKHLLDTERFVSMGADLGAGGVRMNVPADRESRDPWERIGIQFGDPTRPSKPSDIDIRQAFNWAKQAKLWRGEYDPFANDVNQPDTRAFGLFEQWQAGLSADARRLRGVAKATWSEERGAKNLPFEPFDFSTGGMPANQANENRDHNWALGFLIGTVFPALRDASGHQEYLKEIRDLILLTTLYYDLGGYPFAGPLDGMHPCANFKPNELTGTHLLDRMVNFLGSEEVKVAGGSSGLAQGSNFNVYMTYNPVLFETTRLYWRQDSSFLFRHPEVIRDIDTVGRYGEAATAAQKAAVTSTEEDEVRKKLYAMYAPAIRLRESRETLTRILRGPTKKRGQAREQRPVGPDELTVNLDEGSHRVTVGVDPMGEAIGHYESLCLLWPLGVDFAQAKVQVTEFVKDPVFYLTNLKRLGVDPALARIREAKLSGVLEEAIGVPTPPPAVKETLDKIERGELSIDPVTLMLTIDNDQIKKVENMPMFSGTTIRSEHKKVLKGIIVDVLKRLRGNDTTKQMNSDSFFTLMERHIKSAKFSLTKNGQERYLSAQMVNAILHEMPKVAILLGTPIDNEADTRAYLRTAAVAFTRDTSVLDPQLTDEAYRARLANRGLDQTAQRQMVVDRASKEKKLIERLQKSEDQRDLLPVRTGRTASLYHVPLAQGLEKYPVPVGARIINFGSHAELDAFVEKDPKKKKQLMDWIGAGLPSLELVQTYEGVTPRMILVNVNTPDNRRMAEIALEAAVDLLSTPSVRKIQNPFIDDNLLSTFRGSLESLNEAEDDSETKEIMVPNVVRPSVRPGVLRPRYDRRTVSVIMGRAREGQRTLPMPTTLPPALDERQYTRTSFMDKSKSDYGWTGQQAIHPHSALVRAAVVSDDDRALLDELKASTDYIEDALRQAQDDLNVLIGQPDNRVEKNPRTPRFPRFKR